MNTTVSAITGKPIKKDRPVYWRTDHELVLRAILLLGSPATDEAIFDVLRRKGVQISPSGARTRRAELVDEFHYVCRKGSGVTESGRSCARWWLTDSGKTRALDAREAARQGRLCA